MHRFHHVFPGPGGQADAGESRLSWRIVAHPHRAGVVTAGAAEPHVLRFVGRTGLDKAQRVARSFSGTHVAAAQQLLAAVDDHVGRVFRVDPDPGAVLGEDLALVLLDDADDAVVVNILAQVGVSGIRLGHLERRRAVGQAAQADGRAVDISRRDGREAHLFQIAQAVHWGHLQHDLVRDGVRGLHDRLADVHLTRILSRNVLRPELILRVVLVDQDLGRIIETGIEAGAVDDDGLDRRTGLALRQITSVEGILRASAADHGFDVTRLIVDQDRGGLERELAILAHFGVFLTAGIQDRLELFLQIRPERGVDLVSAHADLLHLLVDRVLIDGVVGVHLLVRLEDILEFEAFLLHQVDSRGVDGETRHVTLVGQFRTFVDEFQILPQRRVVLRLRDHALFHHAVERVFLTDADAFHVRERIVQRGAFRQTDEDCRFRQRQILGMLPEIVLAGAFDAVAVVPVEVHVDVELHDLVFRVIILEHRSQEQFRKLAVP